jgi:cysteinyl-tRNA synthetase
MALTLYNTLTRQKQPFEPITPGKVRFYCCGVTVYDYCHLGHARSYIVWDMVRRYLEWRGYEVQYIQNYTDIDDKIIRRARDQQVDWQMLTQTYMQAYAEDMARLNVRPADAYPKATDSIPGMIDLIQALMAAGYAYAANGDVYYAVEKFPSYGKLSGRQLDQMEAGASGRVADNTDSPKRHPLDFALWKAAKPDEPAWESPWGLGRPGWHIECSAMVQEYLGTEIDIHAGGSDLIFPHHENEIAQSEAVSASPLSRYWMHNGFVNVGGEKMSKSLGNFTTIRDLLDHPLPSLNGAQLHPMALRLFVLQAQYRKPIDFSDDAIAAAQSSWHTLQEGLRFGYDYGQLLNWANSQASSFEAPASLPLDRASEAVSRFQAAMDDDFNTSAGLVILFELAKDLKRAGNLLTHEGHTDVSADVLREQWQSLVGLAQVLGLKTQPDTPKSPATGLSDTEIEGLIQDRQAARQAKNYAESDRIRDYLNAQGITLIDQSIGTRWHRN